MMRRVLPAVGLLAVVALLLASRPREVAPVAKPVESRVVATAAEGTAAAGGDLSSLDPLVIAVAEGAGGEGEAPAMTPDEARAHALERAERSLALYKEAMVYPPWSRPADGTTRHVLEWNQPWPVGQPFAADAEKRELRVDATLDKLYAAPGEALTATLRVSYLDDGQAAAPDELTGGVEWNEPGGGWQRAADVVFTRDGERYLGRFVPSEIAALAKEPREAQLVADVRIGEFKKRLAMRFLYVAAPPLVVHGVVGDRVVGGSLEVLLDVEVGHVAPTLVQAGLYDAAGKEAIAVFDDYVRPTATGRQTIAVRFFGKILRDRGIDGPYRLRALHGHVRVAGAVPEEQVWSFPDEPAALTGRHRAAAFAGDEWSSREKDDKIARYQGVIADLSHSE